MLSPRSWKVGVLASILAALVLSVGYLAVDAADHADSPDTSQGNLDINDIYAFNRGDDVVLAMTVAPLLSPGEATSAAALNPRGLYEFKLDRERDGVPEAVIQVLARGTGPEQTVMVRGPAAPEGASPTTNRIVQGPAVTGAFASTFSGSGMRVFTGPRDDPFFINLLGDESLTSVLNAVYGQALDTRIGDPDQQTLAFEEPGTDDLAGLNTLAIVVEMPKEKLADALGISPDGTFFVWGATSVRR